MIKNVESFTCSGFEVRNLEVNYYGNTVLKDVSFKMEKGKLGVLLGPNGAGKTSLIKAVTGLIKPVAGETYIDGIPLRNMKMKEQARYISYVPQDHHVVYNYSVKDFILMGRTPYLSIFETPGEKDLKAVSEAMSYLGISNMEDRNYLSLSEGEKQMVLLARALVQNARVMMMDEPTTYLDYQKQHHFLNCLKAMVKSHGMTAVISLHDPNLALKFADKIIMIHEKKVLFEIDCKSRDFLSKLDKGIKTMYGQQVRIKQCDQDLMVFWG